MTTLDLHIGLRPENIDPLDDAQSIATHTIQPLLF